MSTSFTRVNKIETKDDPSFYMSGAAYGLLVNDMNMPTTTNGEYGPIVSIPTVRVMALLHAMGEIKDIPYSQKQSAEWHSSEWDTEHHRELMKELSEDRVSIKELLDDYTFAKEKGNSIIEFYVA